MATEALNPIDMTAEMDGLDLHGRAQLVRFSQCAARERGIRRCGPLGVMRDSADPALKYEDALRRCDAALQRAEAKADKEEGACQARDAKESKVRADRDARED